MTVLAMHPGDLVPIAGVILIWALLHWIRRRRQTPKD